MRISINLASRPFFEAGPLLLRLRILAAVLVIVAVGLFFVLQKAQVRAGEAQAAVFQWTASTQGLQREWQQDQAMMKQPDNAATLERSQFLNGEFRLKSFSWTTALMDLERVLPQGVQVISIDPRMSKTGQVEMRLRVNGPRDKAIQLVSNMEASPHFLNPRVVGEAADVKGAGRAGYQPSMSASTDVNVAILAEFNAGDLAPTDVKAEEEKSGTHPTGSGSAAQHKASKGGR